MLITNCDRHLRKYFKKGENNARINRRSSRKNLELNENGEVTTKKLQRDLDLNDNFINMGLGWLSREDKVNYSKKGSYTKVSLR